MIDVNGQSDDAFRERVLELERQGNAAHDELICHFEPALRKKRGERRLARATDTAENHVGLLEIAWLFSVVTLDREFYGLDSAKVIFRQPAARRVGRLAVEVH